MKDALPPIVAAVNMGYGHLRAARALADALGSREVAVDAPPLAGPGERRLWGRARIAYELTSRLSQIPVAGPPLRWALDEVTLIPALHPRRDLSASTHAVRALDRLIARGLGGGLVSELRRTGRPLLTTFYAPALIAERAGVEEIWCVVTDVDVHRIWAPLDARATRIRYLVPTPRAGRRLQLYGVPPQRISFTGFPLPGELLGGVGLRALCGNLAARLVRLDPTGQFRSERAEELERFLGPLPAAEEGRPPLLTFAVGGAGAQAGLPRAFLPSLRPEIEKGRLRLALVSGTRSEVRAGFEEALAVARLEPALGSGVEVHHAESLDGYLAGMNRLLARTDVLWTKPSELCFFAALGLPLVLASPVGFHERVNRRWVRESGAGVKQRDPRFAAEWLTDMLEDGALAEAAWAGFMRLPKFGLHRILKAVAAERQAE